MSQRRPRPAPHRRRRPRSIGARLARSWAWELVAASCVPMVRAEIELLLRGQVDTLIGALLGDPFTVHPARVVGAELVRMQIVETEALRRSLRLLNDRMLDDLPIDPDAGRYRLSQLLLELSVGWTEALRSYILSGQDDMQRAIEAARRGLADPPPATRPDNPWFT